MKYFVMVALFAIGVSVGVLITPEPPKGYQGFISVEACEVEVNKIYNTALETVAITKECISALACSNPI